VKEVLENLPEITFICWIFEREINERGREREREREIEWMQAWLPNSRESLLFYLN